MSINRTIVLGGARSGKSSFAEKIVDALGKPKVYVATAQVLDKEMQHRIDHHVAQRGPGWRTVEAPFDVAAALRDIPQDAAALLDCATLWLSNQMLADADLDSACDTLLKAIDACPGDLVIVSNEVGGGIVPDNALARRFRDAQGLLNQSLAAACDLAVFVVAGLPVVLKGTLPEAMQ